MKIGILTFHQALNYGAILQAYALQCYIGNNFFDVHSEIIDYHSAKLSREHSISKIFFSNGISKIPFRLINLYVKKMKFRKFIRNNIKLSEAFYNPSTIELAMPLYNLFIVGSDQVWNTEITDGDMNYFLEFAAPPQRFSYAASFGVNQMQNKYRNHAKRLLNEFAKISVRESNSIDLLENIGVNRNVCVNIDPTMLLKKEEWDKLVAKVNRKKKYVFIYTIHHSEQIISLAQKFSKTNNYEIIYVGPYAGLTGLKYIPFPRVEKLLGLFKEAEYVFTNSFHGSVFSILFHKKFLVNPMYTDGRNDRINSLLLSCGLLNRKMDDINGLNEDIDWERVDCRLNREREEAYCYLGKILR